MITDHLGEIIAEIAQLVEHNLAKVGVESLSNKASKTENTPVRYASDEGEIVKYSLIRQTPYVHLRWESEISHIV